MAGCAGNAVAPLSPDEASEIVRNIAPKAGEESDAEIVLTLPEAIERAIVKNGDLRVAAMETLAAMDTVDLERLEAVPEFNAVYRYRGRSNPGASSSRSVISGNESLEPSISSDQYGATFDLDMRWSMLDIALASMRTKIAGQEALAARARYERSLHTVVRDVIAVYGRSYAYQEHGANLEEALVGLEKHIDAIRIARAEGLLSLDEAGSQSRALQNERDQIIDVLLREKAARNELKALLSLPQDARLKLAPAKGDWDARVSEYLEHDVVALEQEALAMRPEVRETIYALKGAEHEINAEIMRSFPGLELFTGFNRDTNSFLEESRWLNFSAAVSQSLRDLFTLPARKRAAENRKALTEQRLRVMAVAVVSQVHLARHRLSLIEMRRQASLDGAESAGAISRALSAKEGQGFISGQRVDRAAAQAHLASMRAALARAEAQEALAGMLSTLGRNPAVVFSGGAGS